MAEAPKHPHNAARKIFVERHGVPNRPRAALLPHALGDTGSGDGQISAKLTKEWKTGT